MADGWLVEVDNHNVPDGAQGPTMTNRGDDAHRSSSRAKSVEDRLRQYALLPVLELSDATDGEVVFRALSDAGLPVAEITLRSAVGPVALERLIESFPGALLGAGTVRTLDQARRMVELGASFIVLPGVNVDIIEYCVECDVLVVPGVCTPTEIMLAQRAGARLLKLFPADVVGGVRLLRALAGPFGDASFVPTGGISLSNLKEYLELPQVAACGGSWLVQPDPVSPRDVARISEVTRQSRNVVEEVRGAR